MVKNLNILIVDDDVKDRKLFKQQIHSLNHYSYKINESNDIIEAEKFLRKDSIDLIFIASNIKGNNSISNIRELHKKFSSVEKILLLDKKNRDNESYDNILDEIDYLIKGEYDNHSIFKTISSAIKKKQMLAEFVTSKNFFHSAIDSLSASIAILNENGIIIFVNKAWRDFAFNNNANMINDGLGLNYIKIAENSTDEEGIGKQVAKAAKDIVKFNSDEFYIEYPCNSDTEKRWFALRLSSFEQNSIRRIVASHENITIKKEAEEKIKTSDKVFNHSIDMLCIAGFDGYYKVLNPAWERVLGWSKEELTSSPWNKFVHPEDVNKSEEIKSELINGLEIYQFENRYVCKDGSIKWLSWNSFPYAEENIMFGVARDITEQKEREIKMQTMNQAVEQSPVSIVVTNVEGKIEYVNPKFSKVTGYTKEEVLGENPRVLKSGDKTDQDYKELWDTITSNKVWHGEFYNKRKDGTSFWEDAKISPILDSEGNISHFVAVKEDITKRKAYEKELINSRLEAQKSDQLKSEFLAQISHEIRTPVNTLLNFTYLIKDSLADPLSSELTDFFGCMNSAGERLIRTIEMILKMSELHTNNFEMEFRENDLNGLIEEVNNKYKEMAHKKDLKYSYINQLENEKLVFDRNSIYDVLSNLIDNAIKYTEQGSIKIHLKKSIIGKVQISIKDTGIGIEKEYINNIFKPFCQGSTGYSRRYEGNGLGLSLVKEYCKLNNIDIFIKSEKESGSEILLTFQ